MKCPGMFRKEAQHLVWLLFLSADVWGGETKVSMTAVLQNNLF